MSKCGWTVIVDGIQLPFISPYLCIVGCAHLRNIKVELVRVFYGIVVFGIIGSPFFLTFKHMLLMKMSTL